MIAFRTASMQGVLPRRPPEVIRSLEVLLELWDELRTKPGPHLFVMRGLSMWPAVPDGSVLAVHPCRSRELAPGEMVTFRRKGTIVTHRVIDVDPDGYVIAWGDSVLRPDQPIDPADVLGKAVLVRRAPVRVRPTVARLAIRRLAAVLARATTRAVFSFGFIQPRRRQRRP